MKSNSLFSLRSISILLILGLFAVTVLWRADGTSAQFVSQLTETNKTALKEDDFRKFDDWMRRYFGGDFSDRSEFIEAGEKLAEIGPYPENGDWPPHLHFQLMTDMLGFEGDFPGVCAVYDRAKFLALCPNPNRLLKIPGLYT